MMPEQQQVLSDSPLERAWSDYRDARKWVANELAAIIMKEHELEGTDEQIEALCGSIEAMI